MRSHDVTFNPLRAGPLDEARIRRALADLGFPQADIEDEIGRAKRLGVAVSVIGAQLPPGCRRPGAVSLRMLVTLLVHVAALVVMLGIATDRTRAPTCAVDRIEGDWVVVERVDGTTFDAHRDVLPDAVEGSYVPCEATEQAAAEHAYRGGLTFCDAHPEVPFCRED